MVEGDAWARPLAYLWQNRPYSLEKEKEYNRSVGLQRPYCAVCMLFHTYQRVRGRSIGQGDLSHWHGENKGALPLFSLNVAIVTRVCQSDQIVCLFTHAQVSLEFSSICYE